MSSELFQSGGSVSVIDTSVFIINVTSYMYILSFFLCNIIKLINMICHPFQCCSITRDDRLTCHY